MFRIHFGTKKIVFVRLFLETKKILNGKFGKAGEIVKEQNLKCIFDIGCGFTTKLDKYIIPHVDKVYGFDQQSAIDVNKKYLKNDIIYIFLIFKIERSFFTRKGRD